MYPLSFLNTTPEDDEMKMRLSKSPRESSNSKAILLPPSLSPILITTRLTSLNRKAINLNKQATVLKGSSTAIPLDLMPALMIDLLGNAATIEDLWLAAPLMQALFEGDLSKPEGTLLLILEVGVVYIRAVRREQ